MVSNMPDRHLEGKLHLPDRGQNYAHRVVACHIPCWHNNGMDNVSKIRQQRGLSQTQLADAIGANQATISKIERGDGNPTLSMIKRIAGALNCEPADLFEASTLRLRVLSAIDDIEDPSRREAAIVVIETMAGRSR